MRKIGFFFLLLISLTSSAQFRVVDASDGKPLEYVHVYSSMGKILGTSDQNGRWLSIKVG